MSEDQTKELKNHSKMLGQIACHVSDFCDEEDTTLCGVLKLLAEHHYAKFQIAQFYLDKEKAKQTQP